MAYYRSDRGSRQEIRLRDVDANSEPLNGEIFVADDKLFIRLADENHIVAPPEFAGTQGTQGPVGPQGTQGVQGTQGSQGNQGQIGAQGFQGNQGSIGPQGTQGSQGDKGNKGDQGFQGEKGDQGFQGTQGTQGFGLQGAQGSTGTQGFQGDVGAQGSIGQQGAQGQQGPTGYQGTQGQMGYQGNQGPTGGNGSQGFQGPQGFQGDQGSTGAQGFQGDVGAQGTNALWNFTGAYSGGASYAVGDVATYAGQTWYRINSNGGNVGDTPSEGIFWTLLAEKGAQGDTGTQGDIGTQGDVGPQGFQGTQGDVGPQGFQGTQGTQGFQGNQGTQGTQGFQGATGSSNSYFSYQAKTTITSGDPASGHIIWNNAIQDTATEINVSDTDQNSNNIEIFLSNLPIGTQIYVQDASNHLNYQEWEITSKTDNGTYWTYGVTYLYGTGYSFTNNQQILLIVGSYPAGPQGVQGAQGTQGVQGNEGTQGSQGPQGTQGAQGNTGPQGTTGAQGNQGTQGATISLYVEEFRNTTAPNTTVPVHGVQAFGAESNIDLLLKGKGTGAIVAQIPDSTSTGGNKRGTNAVDLQKTRTANTQVASGNNSVIIGGINNTAGGTSNAVLAGNDNATTGTSSVIVGGMFNSIDTSVSGAGILSGKDALATNTGQYQAGGRFTDLGDAQRGEFVLKVKTTNATATELLTWGDGDANTDVTSGTKRIVLKDRQSMMIEANVMGVNEADQSKIASYKIHAVARRLTGVANTSVDYKNIITLHEAIDANWNVDVEADTTNGALKFTATGEISKNIRWVANVKTVEIVTPILAFDVEAQAFIDATGITDLSQQTAIENLVVGLKADGVWTKLKAVYPMVGGTAVKHKYNLKDPQDTDGAFRLSFNGTWTHSSTGALPDGTTAWANTHIIPSSHLNLNEGFMGYYSRNNIEGTNDVEMGLFDPAGYSSFFSIGWTSGEQMFRCWNNSQLGPSPNVNSKAGWYMVHRNSSTQIETTRNNSVIYTDTTSASGRSNLKMFLGAYNYNGSFLFSTTRECAFAVWGHLGLTSGEKASLYTRIQNFQTALGRQV